MTRDELHAKLDEALALLADAERVYAAIQERYREKVARDNPTWTDDRVRRFAAIDAKNTAAWMDATTDWSLAHDRIRSYAAAAMAKDLAAFLRPEVSDLDGFLPESVRKAGVPR